MVVRDPAGEKLVNAASASSRNSRIGYAWEVARYAISHPVELGDRIKGRRQRESQGVPPPISPSHSDALSAAHDALGVIGCSSCAKEIRTVRKRILGETEIQHYHDGGVVLLDILWSLVRHSRPERVVETGVARGLSSAFILDALERNERGHLWSIDLPPMTRNWTAEVGSAVAQEVRHRWTYIRGASSRNLPRLLQRLGSIDLFIHDGLHTFENQTFEYGQAWPLLTAGGFLVTDDADDNAAFCDFASSVDLSPILVRETGKTDVVGILRAAEAPS